MNPIDFPEAVKLEMERISHKWIPKRNKRGRLVQRLPAFVPVSWSRGKGECYVDVHQASVGTLEQVVEYNRRRAKHGLTRYQQKPSALLARHIAAHMMYANLASQFFNRQFKQAPLTDCPFPLVMKG
jgi:hypothetical protein